MNLNELLVILEAVNSVDADFINETIEQKKYKELKDLNVRALELWARLHEDLVCMTINAIKVNNLLSEVGL